MARRKFELTVGRVCHNSTRIWSSAFVKCSKFGPEVTATPQRGFYIDDLVNGFKTLSVAVVGVIVVVGAMLVVGATVVVVGVTVVGCTVVVGVTVVVSVGVGVGVSVVVGTIVSFTCDTT